MLNKTFCEEMTRYYEGGSQPLCTTNDFRYSLDMHEQRLKSRGLKIRRRFEPDTEALSSGLIMDSGDYNMSLGSMHSRYVCEYVRDDASNAVIKRVSERRMLNTIELDKKDKTGMPSLDTEITCPNCGSRGTYASFAKGCTSCGTRFMLDQIYPCVENYYSYPELVNHSEVRKTNKSFGKGVATAFIVVDSLTFIITVIACIATGTPVPNSILFGFLLLIPASAIVGIISFIAFMAYGVTLAANFAGQASKTISEGMDLNVAVKRKEEMVAALTQYDANFSYEYFEGKVTSHLRSIAYTSDRKNLTVYTGTGDLAELDDVIDIEYRGALEYLGSSVKDDVLNVDIKAYLFVSHQLSGGVIDRRKQQYKMRMSRKLQQKTKPGYSIHAVNCVSCGISFDAAYQLTCPVCGHGYEPMLDDWIVTHMVLDQDI